MIDRENFDYIKNIIELQKEHDLNSLFDIQLSIKNDPKGYSRVNRKRTVFEGTTEKF